MMDAVAAAVGSVSDTFWSWVLVPLVVVTALYMTVRTGFGQFRAIPQMFRTIREPSPTNRDGRPQSVNAFQAFTLSAASRVGVGNIAGVGTAIAIGGPGAVFWMWAMALLVGAASLIESSLAQLFKDENDDNSFRGGPAYYIQKGLGSRFWAVAFSVTLILCFPLAFNSLQANTLADSIVAASGGDSAPGWLPLVIAGTVAVLVGASIFGGLKRIARVSQTAVPLVAIVYLLVGVVIVVSNIERLPGAVLSIFSDAFGFTQFVGAGIGTVIAMGVRRGMFSNEAGLGSAPNAAAAAAVTHPVKQGLVQTLGVYFDTWLVCSITAFIILVGAPDLVDAPRGVFLTQSAMTGSLGAWAGILLAVIIFLLAFTSLLGNYYYGESNVRFITAKPWAITALRLVTIVVVFIGTLADADLIWNLADGIMGVMALINLVAILLLSPIGFRLWRDYQEQKAAGMDPVFTVDRLPGLTGVTFWRDRQRVVGWGNDEKADTTTG